MFGTFITGLFMDIHHIQLHNMQIRNDMSEIDFVSKKILEKRTQEIS